MRLSTSRWFDRLIFAVFVAATATSQPAWGQPAARVNPDEILTADVITRVLGLENSDLTPDDKLTGESRETMEKKRKLMAEAVVAFRNGDGDGALAKFEDAIQIDASLPPADVFLARLCFAVNDQNYVRLGLSILNRAADKHPEAPESYLMFGQLALLEGRLTDAYVLFEKAAQAIDVRAPLLSESKTMQYKKLSYSGRVSVCEQRQNWDRGLIELIPWLALDPADPSALFRKGRLIFMKDPKDAAKINEARKLFEDAYQAAVAARTKDEELPAVPPAELALLELYTANGEVEKARSEIALLDRKTTEWQADPREGSRVYSTISQWYLGQGEFKQAETYAAKATELDKDSQALKQLTAVLHYFAGDLQAEAEFSRMNQEQPDDFFAANFLALTLADAKTADGNADDVKRGKAVRIAEINARLNPRSPVALATLGWVYLNVGRVNEAAQIFGTLEQQQNLQISPDTAYFMAKTFAALPSAQFPNALGRSKSLLELAVNAGGAFRYRPEAERWLTALGGTVPQRNTGTTVPLGNVPVNNASETIDLKKEKEKKEEKAEPATPPKPNPTP